ncbi:MAG: ABC transporter ATP-binding protein [Rhodospirillaceae bacterium]|jgi:putative ABC transport system ATP-binding protein|nr:ABC transporter ATP-binding protein [Rhodospirillaceae bacterium]
MEKSIFKYILRYSAAQQIYLLCVILAFYPFLFVSLDLPKIIVNRAIKPNAGGDIFEAPIFGYEIEFDVSQLTFLLILSFTYLALVFITGGFKYYISVFKGRMGERLLRRLRYQLYTRILRFPIPHFKKVSQGELIPMITAEVEPLGGFIGIAFADPLFFGGQLALIIGYILLQDWKLGLAAAALIPVQGFIIPKLQKKVNALGKQRVQNVRRLADHLGESVSGIGEIHAHDTSNLEMARFANRLGGIYLIRYEIYRRKFFVKFLNNFIDKLTPFFFFSIGGFLVIEGELTVGALVAVLNAYKDLASPWKELLAWYQQKEDVRIKYEQVVEQFEPQGMLEEHLQHDEPTASSPITAELAVNNVSLSDEDGVRSLEAVSFTAQCDGHLAIVGASGSGKDDLAQVLARLLTPTSGRVLFGGQDIANMPEAVTGRDIAYVGSSAYLQAFSVGDNLVYGLKHRPVVAHEYDGEEATRAELEKGEADVTGNSPHDYNADWIDYAAAGVSGREEMMERVNELLSMVDLSEDVYQMGLRGTIDPTRRGDIADRIMSARRLLRDRLSEPEIAPLIEPFDQSRFNTNATVAENILFGLPADDSFDLEKLAEHPYMRQVLDTVGLSDDFLTMGQNVAQTMVELFADLPPGHEFFEQFSFIDSEDLPDYQTLLGRAARGVEGLTEEDRLRLESLPFMLSPARHRLDLIDERMMERILEAREVFARDLPETLRDKIAFFDVDAYNPSASLQDNILFGKLAYGQAQSAAKMGAVIGDVIDSLELRQTVITVGLDFPAGIGGARLSQAQRQKLAIARAVIKDPKLLILNEAGVSLDQSSQVKILENLLKLRQGKGLVWVLNRIGDAKSFNEIIVMKDGRVAQSGSFDDLSSKDGEFKTLLDEG